MEKRTVLGKGLSALIPEKHNDLQEQGVSLVKTETVIDNRMQPRLNYAPEALDELKASIKEKGILQPILVRKTAEGYEVVAGERRLRAARDLGLEKIPALIKDVTDEESLVIALVENIQREELNPIEEANAFRRLMDDFQMTQEQVAEAVGKERSTVANILRLLKLSQNIQDAVSKGLISMGHARSLLSIPDEDKRYQVFLTIMEKGVSVRQAEQMTQQPGSKKKRSRMDKEKDHEVVRLEEELRGRLGTKVSIDAKKKRGKIVIEYYSLDDLDRILNILR